MNWIIKSKKNVLIYLMITLLPAIAITHGLAVQKIDENRQKYMINAYDYANLHANHIDRFIGETVSRLDMLATLININPNDLKSVEEVLTKTHEKDARFSGFYWANPQGDLLIGTNEITEPINVADRTYFQKAINTGEYAISSLHIGRVTGRKIITIATPVIKNNIISGVLLGSLRIDKIEESLLKQIEKEKVFVTDNNGQMIIQSAPSTYEDPYSYTVQIERVPWTIEAQVQPEAENIYWQAFLTHFGLLLILTHIIFLVIQYFLLKKQVKLEKKQNQMQKLELVENLAASTAHEIRNPLTGIKGLIQLLSEKYKDEKDQLYFTIIQEEVNRINAIVSELLLLGKPTAQMLNTYNVNDIIKEIEPIIQSEANYNSVDLSIKYSGEQLLVSGVKDHLKQVILNLVKNALEAVENNGNVSIALERYQKQCKILVIDNGSGMSEDVLLRIFDPFFTNKENGTGLGLVVCKRIIESYGGKINLQSTVGKGTVVELLIPLATDHDN